MKITKGSLKGLEVKGYDNDSTRATSARVYDSLFDILVPYLKEAKVLDLFSGTGLLGLTALSLGAKSVVFNDMDRKAFLNIRDNVLRAKKQELILNFDYKKAIEYLTMREMIFDIVFLDPPYSVYNLLEIIEFLNINKLVKKNSILVIETDDENFNLNLELIKFKKFGYRHMYIYRIP